MVEGNLPFEMAEDGSYLVGTRHGMVEGIRHLIHRDLLEALMSVEVAWKIARSPHSTEYCLGVGRSLL